LGVRGEAEDVAHAPRGKAVGDMKDGERGEGEAELCIATTLFLFYFLPIPLRCFRLLQPVLLRLCCIIEEEEKEDEEEDEG
jgi:hypothetical protein